MIAEGDDAFAIEIIIPPLFLVNLSYPKPASPVAGAIRVREKGVLKDLGSA